MSIGVRLEPELERQLDHLAERQGKSRSACVREAIRQYVHRFGDEAEAKRQSAVIRQANEPAEWFERVPAWSDWTA